MQIVDDCHLVFFFNDPPTTEIYTLSLHDALPISKRRVKGMQVTGVYEKQTKLVYTHVNNKLQISFSDTTGSTNKEIMVDRKSTRLNSSHGYISYAVFCLKKKKKT